MVIGKWLLICLTLYQQPNRLIIGVIRRFFINYHLIFVTSGFAPVENQTLLFMGQYIFDDKKILYHVKFDYQRKMMLNRFTRQ